MKNIVKWDLVKLVSWLTFIKHNFYNFYLYVIRDICCQNNVSTYIKMDLLHLIRNEGSSYNLIQSKPHLEHPLVDIGSLNS